MQLLKFFRFNISEIQYFTRSLKPEDLLAIREIKIGRDKFVKVNGVDYES